MGKIGSGDIGNVLTERVGVIFFAAGVSNSQCVNESQYDRERRRLIVNIQMANDAGNSLFYFSSLSIFFKTSRYTKHKEEMEQLIRANCDNYNIIRIGNIDFGSNPTTFINYFRNCIQKKIPYIVYDEYRYLISKEELLLLTNNLPVKGKNEISVTGRIVKVQTIVDELIKEHDKRGSIEYPNKG